ncbi:MAG: hypothetical protein WBD58_03565 [Geitlerinemataceae cyanobacterium]
MELNRSISPLDPKRADAISSGHLTNEPSEITEEITDFGDLPIYSDAYGIGCAAFSCTPLGDRDRPSIPNIPDC